MDFTQHISDSAFLVNESRARRSDLSGDYYAHHWVDPERRERVRKLWNDFSSCVYPFDDIVLSIRNRFFLERIQAFVSNHADSALVNLGAGFTSYPFLLDRSIRVLEVDFPHVTTYKQSRIDDLTQRGVLPIRSIQFCGRPYAPGRFDPPGIGTESDCGWRIVLRPNGRIDVLP
jgi:hypothetical protein